MRRMGPALAGTRERSAIPRTDMVSSPQCPATPTRAARSWASGSALRTATPSAARRRADSNARLTVDELSTIGRHAPREVRPFLRLGNSPETIPEAPFLKEADGLMEYRDARELVRIRYELRSL